MIQLILHLFGDYVIQSDWMANNKMKCSKAAAAHAITYSLPFLLLQPSWIAFAVIMVTHFFIDRFRLARFVVWAKNCFFDPRSFKHGWPCEFFATDLPGEEERTAFHKKFQWGNCSATGYPSESLPWLAVWLLIAADNTIHLAINYLSLRYL